jgi:hypothetical protein
MLMGQRNCGQAGGWTGGFGGCAAGYLIGWTNGRTFVWKSVRFEGRTYRGRMYRWTDLFLDIRIVGRTNGRTWFWLDIRTCVSTLVLMYVRTVTCTYPRTHARS